MKRYRIAYEMLAVAYLYRKSSKRFLCERVAKLEYKINRSEGIMSVLRSDRTVGTQHSNEQSFGRGLRVSGTMVMNQREWRKARIRRQDRKR